MANDDKSNVLIIVIGAIIILVLLWLASSSTKGCCGNYNIGGGNQRQNFSLLGNEVSQQNGPSDRTRAGMKAIDQWFRDDDVYQQAKAAFSSDPDFGRYESLQQDRKVFVPRDQFGYRTEGTQITSYGPQVWLGLVDGVGGVSSPLYTS